MSSSNTNLIYNSVTKVVSISNNCIVEETDLYVAIPDDNEFHVMLIEEEFASESQVLLTTVENFYKVLHEYVEDYEITGKYIVKLTTSESNKFIVRGTYHVFGSNLCNFCLYKITKKC